MNAIVFLSYLGVFFIGVIATLFGLYLFISHEEKKTEKDILAATLPLDPHTQHPPTPYPSQTSRPI